MEINKNTPPRTASGMKVGNAPAEPEQTESFVPVEKSEGGLLHKVGDAIHHLFHHEESPEPQPGAWFQGPDGKTVWYTESQPPPPRDAHGHWVIDTACGADDWFWAKDGEAADGPECGTQYDPSKSKTAVCGDPSAPTSVAPTVKWSKNLSVNGRPLIGPGGKLFVSTNYPDQALHAFDPATGSELWKQSYYGGGRGPGAPVMASDGSLVVPGDDGSLHAVDPSTGKDLWNVPVTVDGPIQVHDDGRLSFMSGGAMRCLDVKSHQIVSSTPVSSHGFEAPPVLGKDGTVYGGSTDHSVYALESGTGKVKWSFKTGDIIRDSPTIGPDGTVYVASIDQTLHALDPQTGAEKWNLKTNNWTIESPSIGPDGTVYFGNSDNFVYAVDPATGKEKWQFYCGSEIRVSPLPAADGRLYVVTDGNQILGLDQATGAKAFNYKAESYVFTPPAVDDKGNMYFGANNERLYGVDTRSPAPASAPPSAAAEQTYLTSDGSKP